MVSIKSKAWSLCILVMLSSLVSMNSGYAPKKASRDDRSESPAYNIIQIFTGQDEGNEKEDFKDDILEIIDILFYDRDTKEDHSHQDLANAIISIVRILFGLDHGDIREHFRGAALVILRVLLSSRYDGSVRSYGSDEGDRDGNAETEEVVGNAASELIEVFFGDGDDPLQELRDAIIQCIILLFGDSCGYEGFGESPGKEEADIDIITAEITLILRIITDSKIGENEGGELIRNAIFRIILVLFEQNCKTTKDGDEFRKGILLIIVELFASGKRRSEEGDKIRDAICRIIIELFGIQGGPHTDHLRRLIFTIVFIIINYNGNEKTDVFLIRKQILLIILLLLRTDGGAKLFRIFVRAFFGGFGGLLATIAPIVLPLLRGPGGYALLNLFLKIFPSLGNGNLGDLLKIFLNSGILGGDGGGLIQIFLSLLGGGGNKPLGPGGDYHGDWNDGGD